MTIKTLLFVVTFLYNAHASPTITTSTEAMEFLRRQANGQLIGYIGAGANYQASSCLAGAVWSTAGNFGLCCPSAGACQQVTACVGSTAVAYNGPAGTSACAAASPVCVVDLVLPSSGGGNAVSWIGCDIANRAPLSFYRNNPAVATPNTPSASAQSSPATQSAANPQPTPTASSSPTAARVTSTVIASITRSGSVSSVAIGIQTVSNQVVTIWSNLPVSPSGEPALVNNTSKSSKAWIAGAVVGPIVALSIIAALVMYILRSKRKPASQDVIPPTQYPQTQEVWQTPMPAPHYYEVSGASVSNKSNVSELMGSRPMYELDAARR